MNMPWAIAGIVAGLVAGSFLSTLVVRWPRGETIARGRSRCDGCGKPIGALRLVPLLSYAMVRGRCGACAHRIDPHHPAMEAAAAAIGLLSMGMHPGVYGMVGALCGWILLTLAILDFEHFWLPDLLTLPLALIGLGYGLVAAHPGLVDRAIGRLGLAVGDVNPALADRAIGAVAGFLLLWLIAWAYRRTRGREGLGLGDAKLLGAIGAWLGWRVLPWVLLGASAIGFLLCLTRLAGGRTVALTDRLPLGTLLAIASWAIWLFVPPYRF